MNPRLSRLLWMLILVATPIVVLCMVDGIRRSHLEDTTPLRGMDLDDVHTEASVEYGDGDGTALPGAGTFLDDPSFFDANLEGDLSSVMGQTSGQPAGSATDADDATKPTTPGPHGGSDADTPSVQLAPSTEKDAAPREANLPSITLPPENHVERQ